jgi:hypothetical protein
MERLSQFVKPPTDTLLRYFNMFHQAPSLSSLQFKIALLKSPLQRLQRPPNAEIFKNPARLLKRPQGGTGRTSELTTNMK